MATGVKRTPTTGSLLEDLRKAADLTQTQLAALAGTTQQHVCRLENDQEKGSPSVWRRLATALRVPETVFTDLEQEG